MEKNQNVFFFPFFVFRENIAYMYTELRLYNVRRSSSLYSPKISWFLKDRLL